MLFNSESRFTSRRTYVVKVRSDAAPGALAGRLENVLTGVQCEFASGAELLESIAADMAGADAIASGERQPEGR